LSLIRYQFIRKPISESPTRYDGNNINVGDISRYFRCMDPSLPCRSEWQSQQI